MSLIDEFPERSSSSTFSTSSRRYSSLETAMKSRSERSAKLHWKFARNLLYVARYSLDGF